MLFLPNTMPMNRTNKMSFMETWSLIISSYSSIYLMPKMFAENFKLKETYQLWVEEIIYLGTVLPKSSTLTYCQSKKDFVSCPPWEFC